MKKSPQAPYPQLSRSSFLVDTHCHLDMVEYSEDIDTVLNNASNNNIRTIVSVGIDINSSMRAVKLAQRYKMVFATVGVHPHDVENTTSNTYDMLADLAQEYQAHVVGYGEIGLDYAKQYSSPETQRRHLRNQLSLANDLHLPVIIHDRDAHEDVLRILRSAGPMDRGGVLHCFSGDLDFAKEILDLGLYISIPGTVTFKNAPFIKEVAAEIPLESLVLETDGPFLAPHPFRGKRNEPSFLLYTAQAVAELRGMTMDDLAIRTSKNAITLFGLNHLPTTDL